MGKDCTGLLKVALLVVSSRETRSGSLDAFETDKLTVAFTFPTVTLTSSH